MSVPMSAWTVRSLAALLALLVVAGASTHAQAQEKPAPAGAEAPAAETAPPTPAPPPEPVGFSPTEVTLQADETRKELKNVEQKLDVPDAVAKIQEAFQEREAAIQKGRGEILTDLAGEVNAKLLTDLERAWKERANEIDAWRETLRSYGAQIDAQTAKLEELSQPWRVTRDGTSQAGAETAVARAKTVLGEIAATQKLAKQRTRELVAFQDRISKLDGVVTETLEEVAQAQQMTRNQVFEPDTAPFWKLAVSADAGAAWTAVGEQAARSVKNLGEYLAKRTDRLVLHLAFILAVLLLTAALSTRVKGWAEDEPQLAESARVLRDPFSVALLVGVATSNLFYPLPPAGLSDLVGLLLLIPAVTLLPRLLEAPMRPVAYALALFWLASWLRDFVEAVPLLSRSIQLVTLGTAIVFLAWLIRPARLAKIEDPSAFPAWLGAVARIMLVLSVVAFGAALLGYSSFATALGHGILLSAYVALLLYGMYRVLSALTAALLHTDWARHFRGVRVGEASIRLWVSRLLRVGLFTWWLSMSLEGFAIREAVLTALGSVVSTEVQVGSVAISLEDVLLFVAVVVAAFMLSRFIRFVLDEDVFPRVVLRRGVSNAISTTVHYTILIGGFLLAVAAAGMDLSRVTLLAGAFGVGIGFGLQNIVNNFVSGMILLFERPIQVGDTIEVVGGLLGDVRRIGPRSSTVRTFDGAEVIVPNGMLISDQVINWTLSDRRRRLTVTVGVKYGTDPEKVLEILREVAGENETVLEDPTPLAIFRGFGDSSLDFELRCWIPRYEEGLSMSTVLLTAINAKLKQAGIEIPFPQRDLHLRSVDEPAREALEEVAGSGQEERAGIRLIPDESGGKGR